MWGVARELDHLKFETVHLYEQSYISDKANVWADKVDRQVMVPDNELEVAREAIASQELDILFSAAYTGFRYFLSHARLAPVQCVMCEPSWTDGVPNFDYYISWGPAEPSRLEEHYTSAVALLARPPYWVERNYTAPESLCRENFDLPPESRWYVCTQSPYKFHPDFDRVLARILAADTKGVIVLVRGGHNPMDAVTRRLRAALGSEADRLWVLPTLSARRCHALLGLADAVIDTWPLGGMSSSYAAIHAGIPTVTLPADRPFGRWLAAMYEWIGVTDLIAADEAEYIRLAVKLANEPEWRSEIAARIKARNGIMIEDRLAVRELEAFLTAAVEAAHRGERPRNWKDGGFISGARS
jgi:predicted O-linked N-acetylglucosamine transferase (SPINDLY family)